MAGVVNTRTSLFGALQIFFNTRGTLEQALRNWEESDEGGREMDRPAAARELGRELGGELGLAQALTLHARTHTFAHARCQAGRAPAFLRAERSRCWGASVAHTHVGACMLSRHRAWPGAPLLTLQGNALLPF